MIRLLLKYGIPTVLVIHGSLSTVAAQHHRADVEGCRAVDFSALGRNPTEAELRCRYDVRGPGRFGLLSHADVPVYQPKTPMPGTHMIGVAGQPRPLLFESFEEWEWRVLRTGYGPEVRRIHRDLEMLDAAVAAKIVSFEQRLAAEGIRASRRETWRTPQRQAYLFQQGRSRPGPLATTTLTSWHSQVDGQGNPAGRAVDYDVATSLLRRFHEIAADVGLASYGPDSYDPGHVYLPLADAIPSSDFVLLRTIPRVPEVTLSTGLPVDRPLPAGGRDLVRQRSFAFAELPYSPYPTARIAAPSRAQTLWERSQMRPVLPLRLASAGGSGDADE